MENEKRGYSFVSFKVPGGHTDALPVIQRLKEIGAFDVSVRCGGGNSGQIQAFYPNRSNEQIGTWVDNGIGKTSKTLADERLKNEIQESIRDSAEALTLSHEICDSVMDLCEADSQSEIQPATEATIRRRVAEILDRYSVRVKGG